MLDTIAIIGYSGFVMESIVTNGKSLMPEDNLLRLALRLSEEVVLNPISTLILSSHVDIPYIHTCKCICTYT